MQHLAVILAVFLLIGCQPTNTVPPKDTSPLVKQLQNKLDAMAAQLEAIEKQRGIKKEVVPTPQKEEKAEHQLKKPNVPTVVTTKKPLMCSEPSQVLKAIRDIANEVPLAMWKDAENGYRVVLMVNKEKKTSTVLEYIPGPFACFLSVGKDLYITDLPPTKTKSDPVNFIKEVKNDKTY